jgi:hypothetical protein
MRRTVMAFAVTASVGLVGAFVAAPPASAAASQARLTVKVKPARGAAKAAWLTCAPDGGSHRRAVEACAVLDAAGGDPAKIPATDGVCTMEYAPVILKVTGRWNGRAVNYRKKFGNACGMYLATGDVARL